MNLSLKKAITLIVISVLLLNSSGYILFYISTTHLIKKYIIKKVLGGDFDKEIILLSISRQDIDNNKVSFKWIHSREFRFNGKMYDIKSNLSDKDSLRFYCYYDEKENLLEELFNKHSDTEKDNNKLKKFSNLFSFIGVFLTSGNAFNHFFQSEIYLVYLITSFQQPFMPIITPPPQFKFV